MKILIILSVLFLSSAVIAQDKYASDRTLIEQTCKDLGIEQPVVEAKVLTEVPLDLHRIVSRHAYRPAKLTLEIPMGIEDNWVSYPSNWPSIAESREKYKDGVSLRTPGQADESGEEWYTVVYDISDLLYEVPNFESPYGFSPHENYTRALDANYRYQYRFDIFDEPDKITEPSKRDRKQELENLIRLFAQTRTPGEPVFIVP